MGLYINICTIQLWYVHACIVQNSDVPKYIYIIITLYREDREDYIKKYIKDYIKIFYKYIEHLFCVLSVYGTRVYTWCVWSDPGDRAERLLVLKNTNQMQMTGHTR